MKVDIFVEVHKHINGHSPGYMSDLLVLNSDINDQNNRNSSLNLVCPHFKRETECGGRGGRGAYFWCKGNKTVECSAKFFN